MARIRDLIERWLEKLRELTTPPPAPVPVPLRPKR